jgi:hypothetical protein
VRSGLKGRLSPEDLRSLWTGPTDREAEYRAAEEQRRQRNVASLSSHRDLAIREARARVESERREKESDHAAALEITVVRAKSVFDWVKAILPRRVEGEEVGDALEQIEGWRRDPRCKHARVKIVLKVVSTLVVVSLNSIRFLISSLKGSDSKEAKKE